MKLWVDDVRPAPKGWVAVTSVAEAKRHLTRGHVTAANLDHDMPGENGQQLLEWMRTTGHWPTEFAPRVHSGNVDAAIRMKQFIAAYSPKPPMPGRGVAVVPAGKLSTGGSTRYHARPKHY